MMIMIMMMMVMMMVMMIIQSFIYAFIHVFYHSITHALTNSLIHSLSHSLSYSLHKNFAHELQGGNGMMRWWYMYLLQWARADSNSTNSASLIVDTLAWTDRKRSRHSATMLFPEDLQPIYITLATCRVLQDGQEVMEPQDCRD